MKEKLVWAIFGALVGVFAITVSVLFIPSVREFNIGFLLVAGAGTVFLLGGALIVLVVRQKLGGMLRGFLLLTGACATGFFVFFLLHNFVYGLFIQFFGAEFWNGGDEPFFFILAALICPLGFIVGAIGSIVLAVRRRSRG
ncbi:MAG: hypothetical protein H8E40_00110 [Chloroflexi bacterium]|nr:hypothetical protein [Chloroflexota bacterium]